MRHPTLRAVTSTSDRRHAGEIRKRSGQRLSQGLALPPHWRGLASVADSPLARPGGFGLALGGILAFSFLWVWHVGHRGPFMVDQAIVFDGAWRILQGQVPYLDFALPFGPVTFVLSALAFWATGAGFSGLVLAAALLSSVACAVTIRIGWLLTGRCAPLALLAGFMSAVWFQAPSGTPWLDQTGFFFDLLALWAMLEARVGHGARGLMALAGVASAAAVLSQQHAGGLFVLVCVGAASVPGQEPRRELWLGLGLYVAGLALAAAAFAGWLLLCSDASVFAQGWLGGSSESGPSQLGYRTILGALSFRPLVPSSIPLFLLASLVGALEASRLLAAPPRGQPDAHAASCAWLCLALPQFHAAFQLTTGGDPSADNAFVGLCVACLGAVLMRWKRAAPRLSWQQGGEGVRVHLAGAGVLRATAIVVGLLSVCSLAEGLRVGAGRFEGVERPGTAPTPQGPPRRNDAGPLPSPATRLESGAPGPRVAAYL
jgi:hypothetical protein